MSFLVLSDAAVGSWGDGNQLSPTVTLVAKLCLLLETLVLPTRGNRIQLEITPRGRE